MLQTILSQRMGTLSRISFHHPPTFLYFDVVITMIKFLRTKKDLNRFKYKSEDFISRCVTENSNDESGAKENETKFLSYGTV